MRPHLQRVPKRLWLVLLVVLAAQVPLYAWHLGQDDLVGGDEGYYANAAGNFRYGPAYLANPSLEPLGPPGDKPFLYHVALRAAQLWGGDTEGPMRAVSLLTCLALVGVTALLAAVMAGPIAGACTALLAFGTSALYLPSRTLMAEPPLTLFCAAGLLAVVIAGRRSSKSQHALALIAGGLFGLGFLCKLWLVVLPGLSAVVWMSLEEPAGLMDRGRLRRAGRRITCFAGGFALGALPHLLLVSAITPATLPHWLGVYFGFSLAGRLGGEGFSGYWIQPFWWYGEVLLQVFSVGLPFVALGLVDMAAAPSRRLRGLTWSWLLAFALVSTVRVKSFYYLVPLYPLLFLTMGMGAATAFRQTISDTVAPRSGLRWALLLAVALVVLSQCGGGAWPRRPLVLMVQLAVLACVAPAAFAPGTIPAKWGVVAGMLIALVAADERAFHVGQIEQHRMYYRDLAALFSQPLRDPRADSLLTAGLSCPPNASPLPLQYIGPEWPALSHYLWRRGTYWNSALTQALSVDSLLRGRVPLLLLVSRIPGTMTGGDPSPENRALLARRAVDVTAWTEHKLGAHLAYRVLANPALAGRLPRGADPLPLP